MSVRGLVVALLCGVLGLGLGALVAYAAEPGVSDAGSPHPIEAISPSVPIDEPTVDKPARDISYPRLSPDLALPPPEYTIGNDLATWTYHIPAGWQAYAVCSNPGDCPPPMTTDTPGSPLQALRMSEVRYRPPGEPKVGGYSLRVKALDNTLGLNPAQMVSTKISGFKQAFTEFQKLKQTPTAVYFTFRDATNHLRYNYFQWFAVPGSDTATLEMSVAGRQRDVPGLEAMFNRFADNVSGTADPYHPPKKKQQHTNAG